MDEPSFERDRAITRGLKPKSNAPAALTQTLSAHELMTELSFDETGNFTYDSDDDAHRSRQLTLPMLGRDVTFVLVGFLDDPAPSEFRDVVRNLLSRTRDTLLAVSPDLQEYCTDINQFLDSEDELHVENPDDLWNHVSFGGEVYIERRHYGDRKLYATIECGCDWEEEHGLQLVLREGLAVTKLGPYDGHLSNADAYADSSLEHTVYRTMR